MIRRFHDRREAGRVLARRLSAYAGRDDVGVLALPRGGVVVGYEVAHALGAPLDVLIVRKLGLPGHEELGFGAIASGGVRVLNRDLVRGLRINQAMVDHVVGVETLELQRRERIYRAGRPAIDVAGRTVILVDDGLATGATMMAAITALQRRGVGAIVVAVPVASREACAAMSEAGATCVCDALPTPFAGVGMWYDDFSQTTDAEVTELLAKAAQPPRDASAGVAGPAGGR